MFLPRRGDHQCGDLLTESLIGMPQHRDLAHPGDHGQHLLHLGGVDVESAADDHVRRPIHQVDIPLMVDPGDVAGAQPVAVEGLVRGSGVPGVAAEDRGPPDLQLTHRQLTHWHLRRGARAGRQHVALLADQAHLRAPGRRAHRAMAAVGAAGVHTHRRRRLRGAIALQQSGAGDHLLEPLGEPLLKRRAPGSDVAQRGEVTPTRAVGEHVHEHGGHPGESGHPVPGDQVQHRGSLELRQQHQGHAPGHGRVHLPGHAEDVMQRQAGEHDVVGPR